jgi:hypothetical protein
MPRGGATATGFELGDGLFGEEEESSTAASGSESPSDDDDAGLVLAWLATVGLEPEPGVATAFTPAPPAPSSPGRLSLMSVGSASPTNAVWADLS